MNIIPGSNLDYWFEEISALYRHVHPEVSPDDFEDKVIEAVKIDDIKRLFIEIGFQNGQIVSCTSSAIECNACEFHKPYNPCINEILTWLNEKAG